MIDLKEILKKFSLEDKSEGEVRGEVLLINYSKPIYSKEVLEDFEKEGLLPANLYEIYHYADTHPESEKSLVALDKIWDNKNGYLGIPALRPANSDLDPLVFYWDKTHWSDSVYFGAIKK